MSSEELCFKTACEMRRLIERRELSSRELLDAHLAQIERYNGQLNAIVTLVPELAQRSAAEADERQAAGEPLGPLHGLPVAHKDLVVTRGIRTTFGSPIYADFVPDEDALIVQRLRAAGAVTVGKTNTPEFGAGSQTYNEVFGETPNPYDPSRTCGGSSGGAAVALATGMIPIADGSDTGGSLRNPASFCNVVGLRTSPGRVPVWPSEMGWFPISVQGPMARTVEDTALMLSAIAGPDDRSPISIDQPGSLFSRDLERDFHGTSIAWIRDLGGLPVDPDVTAAIDRQRPVFETLGCRVDDAEPDFSDADQAFKAWRAWKFEHRFRELLQTHREALKDTIVWNAEEGERLSGPELATIESRRTQLYQRVREFMQQHEFLVLPVSQVPPFDISQRYVQEINGIQMETYIDWMKSCYYISAIGLPAISVPCGFTPDGLPIGVQIVGRHQDDWGVLQLAYAFQQATAFGRQRPPCVANF